MKLLAVRVARSIWLIPQHFLNPRGVFTRPLGEAFKARYQFEKTPFTHPPASPNDGWKFENGAFKVGGSFVQIIHMTVHSDGVVVETRSSTDDGDAYLDDAISFVSKEYGLPPVAELPIRRIYASELNVFYPKKPQLLDPKTSKLIKEIKAAFGDEAPGGVDLLSLQLGNDTTVAPRQLAFRIDREVNTSIAANRYWSYAPMPTAKHIQLLELIEDLG